VLSAVSCAATASHPPPLLFSGGPVPNADFSPREIVGNELTRAAKYFDIDPAVLNSRSHWWLVVGDLKSTGGWSWAFQNAGEQYPVRLCIRPPPRDTAVSMSLTSPTALIGSDSSIAPLVVGTCL
jgi:hypothetical protein